MGTSKNLTLRQAERERIVDNQLVTFVASRIVEVVFVIYHKGFDETGIQQRNFSRFDLVMFFEILSDGFIAKTGFDVYAYTTPVDMGQAYEQCQLRNTPMRLFAREYVRHYV